MTAQIITLYEEEEMQTEPQTNDPLPTIHDQLESDLDELERAAERVAAYQNHTLQHSGRLHRKLCTE